MGEIIRGKCQVAENLGVVYITSIPRIGPFYLNSWRHKITKEMAMTTKGILTEYRGDTF